MKAIVALPEMNALMQLPNTLPYMKEIMTCTFRLQLQTVMHTHTSTGLRPKTPIMQMEHSGRKRAGKYT